MIARIFLSSLMLVPALSAAAQDAAPPIALRGVLAVERADSPLGDYRVVFTTSAPLPPVRDDGAALRFFLGEQELRLPPYARGGPLLFGYVRTLPNGPAALRIAADEAAPAISELPIDAAALLAKSRPADGEYEPPHIRRSLGVFDLCAAWDSAPTVVVATLMRRETHPASRNVWRLYYQVESTLRGEARAQDELLVLQSATVPDVYELGGRFVVFIDRPRVQEAPTGADALDSFQAVRLWWKSDDPVRAFLDDYARRSAAGAPPAADWFVASLRSPAREVRLTAARRLLDLERGGLRLTVAQNAAVGERLATEPSGLTRAALAELDRPAGR